MSTTTVASKPPSLFWTMTEGRAIFELASFRLLRNSLKNLPKGDGHPVLVLPGFMASDFSTRPMRRLLDDLGYQTFGWGLGRNVRFNKKRESEMSDLIEGIFKRSAEKISIVGWSLGGVFARELAKQHPNKVRFVISLGSPISNDRRHSAPSALFERINGKETAPEAEGRYANLDKAPPVPTTSILTKTDGIVSWRGSVQSEQHGALTENIVVPASHVGLGVNPLAMVAIADRLAQPHDDWAPFDRSGWRQYAFREI
ncbi:MAG: alpha/beta hydrolase [Henriciella sp.]|nr:alpha/beta hydrolase [Henriciella sp.]